MTEKTIAKFKYENNTYKLLEITTDTIINDIINQYGKPATTGKHQILYLIVKNRKRLTRTRWEGIAKQKFANLIAGEILQTKLKL